MITEEILLPIFDSIDPNLKTVSILKRTVLKRDGEIISYEDHRCGFAPGDLEKVKQYCGLENSSEIDYLNAIWTSEAISFYKSQID